MKDWIPVIAKLVWPALITIALLIFKQETREVYQLFVKAVGEGRSVEVS